MRTRFIIIPRIRISRGGSRQTALPLALALAAMLAAGATPPLLSAAGLTCNGKEATITRPNQFGQYVGTSGNDVIVASDLSDTIDGRGGNDTICGLGGNDTIFGFDGKDTILGGRGNDALYGEGGADVIRGEDGDDYIVGSGGRDKCNGGAGTDTVGPGASCEKQSGIENA